MKDSTDETIVLTANGGDSFGFSLAGEFYARKAGGFRRFSSFDPSITGSISLIYSREDEVGGHNLGIKEGDSSKATDLAVRTKR